MTKVMLITGASRGIGAATARLAGKRGWNIAVNYASNRGAAEAVVAEIANSDGVWRPGSFVTAAIAVEEQSVPLAVPTSAIQTVGGDKVVFVRTAEGFEKRPVVLGRDDGRFTEIVVGLNPGETIAATNTFPLKAEFLKGQTED